MAGVSKRFEFLGGALCLDLINTVGWRATPREIEFVPEWPDMAAWVRQAGFLSKTQSGRLEELSDGRALLKKAKQLRECLHRLFTAVIEGHAADDADVEILNTFLWPGMARTGISRRGKRFGWMTRPANSVEDDVLWPIARSAAELLTSDVLNRVRVCADGTCGWLFLDATKNKRRAWCAMRICGNRHKARRHRAHLKASSQ